MGFGDASSSASHRGALEAFRNNSFDCSACPYVAMVNAEGLYQVMFFPSMSRTLPEDGAFSMDGRRQRKQTRGIPTR
jgi:hypothetical protein